MLKKIDKIECYKTEHCCILGTELANFKYLHIIKKCINCVNETDIFKVLECTGCNSVKNKMKDCYKKMKKNSKQVDGIHKLLHMVSKTMQEIP